LNWGKKYFEEEIVNHPKYKHFFAVHETEAWLLSDTSLFSTNIAKALNETLKKLKNVMETISEFIIIHPN